jgi:hypothetical protein
MEHLDAGYTLCFRAIHLGCPDPCRFSTRFPNLPTVFSPIIRLMPKVRNALLRDADGTLRAFMDGNRQKSLHLAENRLFID